MATSEAIEALKSVIPAEGEILFSALVPRLQPRNACPWAPALEPNPIALPSKVCALPPGITSRLLFGLGLEKQQPNAKDYRNSEKREELRPIWRELHGHGMQEGIPSQTRRHRNSLTRSKG